MRSYIYFLFLLANSFMAAPEFSAPSSANEKTTAAMFNPSVDAGEDVVICNPGETVTLTATTSPDVLYLEWSPAQFLGNPFLPAATATVNNTTTFTVTVGSAPTTNLFTNGDFADPNFNSFFTTDYFPASGGPNGPLTEPAQLAIGSDPNAQNINWATFPDFTGDGNMLIVNGHVFANNNILCQTIAVTPNTYYQVSANIASAIADSPAFIRVTINGVTVEGINAPAIPGAWAPLSGVWNSGPSTSATICFQDLNLEWNGNDFAMDGITFGPLCIASDQVTVELAQLDASFETPDTLCLTEAPLNLDDFLQPQTTPGGTWFVNGNPDFFFDPLFVGEGLHLVTYSVENFPCQEDSTRSIVVVPPPNADWTNPGILCDTDSAFDLDDLLDNTAEPGGTWNINGTPATTFDPADLGPGMYDVNYTAGDIATGCTRDNEQVIEVLPQTIASWSNPSPICEDDAPLMLDSLLNAEATPGGTWTIDGVDTNIVYPDQLGPGDYILSYAVSNAACDSTQTDTLSIIGLLDASINISDDSICLGNTATVTFDGLANNATSFNWDFGGAIASPGTGNAVQSLSFPGAGTYTIRLWLDEASCQSDTAVAIIDVISPLAPPQPVCGQIGNSDVTFTWPDVPNAVSYTVDVVSGQSGGMITGNSFSIGGLAPAEEVQIIVSAVGNAPCLPVPSAQISCSALDCTPPVVQINPVADICLDSSAVSPFLLTAMVTPDTGVGTWSGPGITDANTGLFDPIQAGLGLHMIIYDYAINSCSAQDTTMIQVWPLPVANFIASDSICLGDTTTISYDGIPNGMMAFTWTLDGGTPINIVNDPVQNVFWDSPGQKTITLTVEENGCISDIFTDTITVVAPLELPIISCNTTETSIEFTWNNQPGVNNYVVTPLSGPAGTMNTDTSYLVNGLVPGTMVSINLTAESSTPCPNVSTSQSCEAVSCPDITASIDTVFPICLTMGTTPFIIGTTISDGITTGTYTWSGPGITDNMTGLFSPLSAGVGSHQINLIYQRGSCFFNTSTTIIIYPTPTSDFSLSQDTMCIDTSATITYLGNASDSASYTWNFGTGMAMPGTGQGPHQISWGSAGNQSVSLYVVENGCTSDTSMNSIHIDELLDTIVISCLPTYSTVLFSWNNVANADSYIVNSIMGPPGVQLTDTSYLITNLLPEQEVSISIDVISSTSCAGYQMIENCSTLACPDISLDIAPVSAQCFNGNSDTINLSVNIINDNGNGTLSWSGAGIIDSMLGIWVTDASQLSQQNWIIASWQEGVCVFTDSILLNVFATPTSSFVVDSIICQADTANVIFTGSTTTAAPVFEWDFDGANTISGVNEGPYQINWDSPGSYTLSLVVTENGCPSDTSIQTVTVDPLLESPAISCTSTTTSVTFSWPDLPNVNGYDLIVSSGQTGMFTTDTTYLVDGLMPGESVSIQLSSFSSNACPDIVTEQTCSASLCPDVTISITPVDDQCYTGIADTIPLQVQLDGTSGNGTLTWSGDGIFAPALGLWATNSNQINANNELIATWVDGPCMVADTISFNVFDTPSSDFMMPDTICMLDTAFIFYTGNASVNATYNWDFGSGVVISGSGSGPYEVQWDGAGNYNVQLTVSENNCISTPTQQQIEVEDTLQAPVIECITNTTSVEFTWAPVAFASDYEIIVLSGQTGMFTSDTSYIVEGLVPTEEASIQLTSVSDNACPSVSTTQSCFASECPNVTIDIVPIDDQCYEGNPDTLSFDLQLTGDGGNGAVSWFGSGIIDSTLNVWVVDQNQLGAPNEVIAVWRDSVCVFSDTITFNLYDAPEVDFTHPSNACVSDTVMISFTGNASNDAIYNWNFDGANIISGNGVGPYEVQWPDSGVYQLELWLEDNACISDTFSSTISIDPVLEAPVISCQSDYSSILFTWSSVENASSYQVTTPPGIPAGQMLADTAYLIENLTADMLVDIQVTAISSNTCPSLTSESSCSTLPCPDITLTITPIDDQCYTGQPDTLTLGLTINGDIGNGIINWEGSGIINPDTNLWITQANQIEANNSIVVTWAEDICFTSDTINFNLYDTPGNDFSFDSPICIADTANIVFTDVVNASAIYNWDFDGGTILEGTNEGPYQVQWPNTGNYNIELEVVNNGCSSGVMSQPIEIDPTLEAVTIDCETSLTGAVFSWNTVDNADTYEVEVLNGGPIGVFLNDTTYLIDNLLPNESISISVNAVSNNSCPSVLTTAECMTMECPEISISNVGSNMICLGDMHTIEISIEGEESGPYQIEYVYLNDTFLIEALTMDTNLIFIPDEAGTFSIISIENLGATVCPIDIPNEIGFIISEPISSGIAIDPLVICSQTDTLLQLTDLLEGETPNGNWSYIGNIPLDPGSFDFANGTLYPITQAPGTYLFNYEVPDVPPCPGGNTDVEVIILETPVADAGPEAEISCSQSEVVLGGPATSTGNDISYLWTANNNSPIDNPDQAQITVNQADVYTLLVSNTSTGCASSDQVTVNLDDSFVLPFGSISNISCFAANDGVISIDSISGGTPPYVYALNEGPFSDQNIFTGLTPGDYEVQIEDVEGCQATLSFSLIEPGELQVILTANFEGNDNEIQLGNSLTLTALPNIPESEIATLAWQPDSVGCDSCLTTTLQPTATTQFAITITDESGCTASDDMTIFVRKDEGVYLPTAFSPNEDGSNDLFTIYAGPQVSRITSFQIYDRWGNEVHVRENMMPNDPLLGWDGTFNGERLNPAVFVYFAEIELVDGQSIIIEGDVTLMK